VERFICVHGHFYQPPRENPWTDQVELQPSAHPYHDWNERITAECYRPLAELGAYARMSFDFGPTLLHWLERQEPEVYRAVLESDRRSAEIFPGHGSAMAQAYNHIILPLANHHDRVTQIVWGIRDFEWRFGRRPEGMWLPETAVDLQTLEILSEQGIRFTVLAPHQARRTCSLRDGQWKEIGRHGIHSTRSYLQRLPSGKQIHLFFYHGSISRAVSFERLATDGPRLAEKLQHGFYRDASEPQLVSIASDGETYGHHHAGGDRALMEALRRIESEGPARLTNYAEYLDKHPPEHEVEILEKSSWSCSHGIDRWWSDCGCNSGANPGWRQEWRTPLRNALDWLRDSVIPHYEESAGRLFKDPWAARDRSLELILDPSPETARKFFGTQARRPLTEEERRRALKFLDLQRQALLMYTSCGWFFDDVGGIEAAQILRYAARAIELAEELFGLPLEARFLEVLSEARSNDPAKGDGRKIYETMVRPVKAGKG